MPLNFTTCYWIKKSAYTHNFETCAVKEAMNIFQSGNIKEHVSGVYASSSAILCGFHPHPSWMAVGQRTRRITLIVCYYCCFELNRFTWILIWIINASSSSHCRMMTTSSAMCVCVLSLLILDWNRRSLGPGRNWISYRNMCSKFSPRGQNQLNYSLVLWIEVHFPLIMNNKRFYTHEGGHSLSQL